MDENSKTMAIEVYIAAVSGDITIFSSALKKEDFLRKTYEKNNILHVAAQQKQNIFIKAAMNNFPGPTCELLSCEQNSEGNTAIHIAAEVGDQATVEQVCKFYSDEVEGRVMPWRLRNAEGNTAAHLALMYGNVWVARYLIQKDNSIAPIINHSKQTLLHLAMHLNDHDDYGSYISKMKGTSSREKANQLTKDLLQITNALLKTESSIACWRDSDGWTPLHKAASLKPPHLLPVIQAILANCPLAAEVRDARSGQTVLHLLANHQVPRYEDGVALLKMPQIHALRNCRNGHGDTPLHVAAKNENINVVRALLGTSPDFNLKNKDGVAAGTLVKQLSVTSLDHMGDTDIVLDGWRKFTKEERDAVEEGDVAFMNQKIEQVGKHFLVSETPEGKNILHMLMCHVHRNISKIEEFIVRVLKEFPMLITQKNNNGDTPLHLLVEEEYSSPSIIPEVTSEVFVEEYSSSRLLQVTSEIFMKLEEEAGDEPTDALCYRPWRLRNAKGDTPLHVAAGAWSLSAAIKLLEIDAEVAGYVNNRNETPLHLFSYVRGVTFSSRHDPRKKEFIRRMVGGNAEVPYMQDVDGLTPLLAAINGTCEVCRLLNEMFPDCAMIADHKGRTLWHKFVEDQPINRDEYFGYFRSLLNEFNRHLIASKDNDGNTPLHLAISNRHLDSASRLLDCIGDESRERDFVLDERNNEGVSCYDLLSSAEHLSDKLEKNLRKNGNLLYGHRSIYGVPTAKINDYANTIGVVAALLTTITFTAGFTVPGGLDNNNGTPLLLRNAIFQVFVVSDVVAMCLSVMVLFCLLWIMTMGDKKQRILLLDTSVYLLKASFYATLVTFMTGLYVTTIHTAPRIAIFTCVICSFLILILNRSFFAIFVAPSCASLIRLSFRIRKYSANVFWGLFYLFMVYIYVPICHLIERSGHT